jgi:ubiquinone/menaquinone biosynthesis C-methylase UbiE
MVRVPEIRLIPGEPMMDWNSRVAEWEDVAASPAFQRLAAEVIGRAEPVPEDRVIDLGAGTGLLTLTLAGRVADIVAIDYAQAMVDHLHMTCENRHITNVTCTVADLRTIPLPDGSRTLAVSNYAYHHLDHAGKAVALEELYRILAPGGRLVICDMMFSISLRGRDRRIIFDKIVLMAKRGPAGIARVLRNAGRIATRRWEFPERPDAWVALLGEAGFDGISTHELPNETGLVVAYRPEYADAEADRRTPAAEDLAP